MTQSWTEWFRGLSWIEQIQELDRLEQAREVERLSDLVALCHDTALSGTVERAAHEAVVALLAADPERLARDLATGEENLLPFCLLAATRVRDPVIAPGLVAAYRRAEDPRDPAAALSSLVKFGGDDALGLCREALFHPDPIVKAVAIEAVGRLGDAQSVALLQDLVRRAAGEDSLGVCSLDTAQAVEALGRIGSPECLGFLAANVHHPNPMVRRLIQEALAGCGDAAVPHLAAGMERGDTDERILAANALGLIGTRAAADALVGALDRGFSDHPNVKAAVYEGLAGAPSLKALVCLLDGLADPDPVILLAVVSALERNPTDVVAANLAEALAVPGQGDRVAGALVAAGCKALVARLYAAGRVRGVLDRALAEPPSPEIANALAEALEAAGSPEAAEAAARLRRTADAGGGRGRVVVADDARSMRFFYESVLRRAGWDVVVCEDGRAAWEWISAGNPFDLLVTDLNMPRMDGVELVTRLREAEGGGAVPVIMVTTESEASQLGLARSAGVDLFLTKPLSEEDLQSAVERLAAERS